MKKVYIAGPYSSDNILGGLENIRRGQRMAAKLLQRGIAVFCPWLDHQLFLQLREGENITLETIQAHSLAWLKASEAVLCLRGWEKSKGTLTEIQVANECGIPVFFNYHDLLGWNMAETDIQIALASEQIGMTPGQLAKKLDDVAIDALFHGKDGVSK